MNQFPHFWRFNPQTKTKNRHQPVAPSSACFSRLPLSANGLQPLVMQPLVRLTAVLLLTLLLLLAACDANRQPQTVVQVIEVTATPSPAPTHTPAPTAPPDHLAVILPDNLDAFHPGDPLVLRFNQNMDTSLARPLIFSPTLRGTAVWSHDATTLTFTPDDGFSSNRSYTITLPPDLRSASGLAFTGTARWQMKTLSAPFVAGRTPARTTTTDRLPTITLRFNQPMNADSVTAALQIEPPLAYDLAVTTNTLTISLTQPLVFGESYQFTLGKTAVNQEGVSLARPYTWPLSLADPLASVTGPSTRDPEAPITIQFNYPMDAASVSRALEIKPAVQGKMAWNSEGNTLTLTPDGRLRPNTTYTVNFITPLFLQDGSELPPLVTATLTTPPPILSFAPSGHDVSPAALVQIRFDRPMDQAATEAALAIEPAIDGAFEWRETTLIFHPTAGLLAENVSYTVTLAETAVAADGELILDGPQSWNFRTGRFQEVANFGYGPNAQVLDVNGRRAIQYQIVSRGDQQTVGFELYQLDLEQFLDRYASNFKDWWPWRDESKTYIDLTGFPLLQSWQEETGPSPNEWANVQEVIIPADVPPGLYILNLTVGRLNDQLILVLTENTLAVKEANGQIVAWVTDINDDPVPGIEVGIYARNGDLLSSGAANEDGVYRTQLPPFAEGGPPAIEPLIVVARSGDDVTVSGLSTEWQSGYGSRRQWWDNPVSITQSAAFITTDRPIYKPGHEVQFKAIVRLDDDATLTVPPVGTPVTVRIRDGRNNVVQTFELLTNDFGTVNGTFQLADGAMLGNYHVEVVVAGTSHRQLFKVEDYRKPDYEVTITTDADKYLLGDTIAVTVDTAYYFGEPVANASITIRRFTQDYNWYSSGWYEDYSSMARPITGRTDANGRFTTTIHIPRDTYLSGGYDTYWQWGSSTRQGKWGIEATVDDGSHQTVSGFAVVTLYEALEIIDANFGSYVQAPGQPFIVSADVQTIFGQVVANRALTLELGRWQRGTNGYHDVRQRTSLTTDAQGHASTQFTITEPGHYQIRLKGTDARGQDIQYTSYIYAFSDIYSHWYGRDDSELRLDTDKTSYAPGETAQLIIESTISGPALLTWERSGTHREQLINLTAPLTLVEFPIAETDVPNIYVAVNVWQPLDTTLQEHTSYSLPDGRLLTTYHNISVPATTKRLNVTITPDKAQYAPREEATFTVRVTNYRGEPVSAEVSLALVDEAIFALSPELSGPMYDAFYYQRSRLVNTYNSLRPTRELWGGGMGGGGGDGAFPGGPRADFPDTAAWFPVLYTDFNGEVKVTITLPDNLTTWRLTAKATTADTQVGEATANITTWQPIIARPLLPRILTAGDTAVLSAIVHNYSEAAQTVVVNLEIGDQRLAIGDSPTQTVTIAPGGVQIVGWAVTAVEAGEVELLVTAVPESGILGDAIQLPLTIQPLAVPDVTTQIGQFSTRLQTTVDIPADALPMSVVEIQLSRSIAGTLLEGLEYLTGYPYGCVEQTMSRALPNAVVGRALNQLGVTNPTLQAELPAYINASVQRLYGFQHNDGGWGWWFDDPTHDYQTAWVIFGLAQVADAGYEVDPGVIGRGATWLNDNLQGMDARTRAFALYALAEAGQPNKEATLTLADNLDSLRGDVFSLAGLALALDAVGERPLARQIVDGLAETAVNTNGLIHWTGATHDGYYDQKTMASDVRSTALALSAFTQIRPGHELEVGIVRWLMGQRQSQGWGSTNETSFAILGLTDHLLAAAFNEAAASTNFTVSVNGTAVASGALGQGAPAQTVQIPREQLAYGENVIVMTQDGGRPLYYTINGRVYIPQAEIEAAGVVTVNRAYLDPATNKPLETIAAGQLVRVQITVNLPENGSYLIIEDKLPGGLEALNEGLNTTSRIADEYWEYQTEEWGWQSLGYNYKEIFGDRVSFFVTEMSKGQRTFTYFARATLPGTFTALPTEVSGMYTPLLWGRSASAQLAISAGE